MKLIKKEGWLERKGEYWVEGVVYEGSSSLPLSSEVINKKSVDPRNCLRYQVEVMA